MTRKLIAFVITIDIPTIRPRNWPFGGETMLSTDIHPRNWPFGGDATSDNSKAVQNNANIFHIYHVYHGISLGKFCRIIIFIEILNLS
jgi:hypothetical protein